MEKFILLNCRRKCVVRLVSFKCIKPLYFLHFTTKNGIIWIWL